MTTLFSDASVFRPGAPAPAARFAGYPRYNFAGGHNDPDSLPLEALAAAARDVVLESGRRLAIYNLDHGFQGARELREFVARRLAASAGIAVGLDELMITTGSGQGIDLMGRLFVSPGDVVLVEEFTFSGALTRFRNLGATIVAVPLDDEGIDVAALNRICGAMAAEGRRVAFLYAQPTIQNPTGAVMSVPRREELLAVARAHRLPILEDDCYADLTWDLTRPPALMALDRSQVVYIGSFSKSLAPALRVGFVAADWAVISRMIPCRGDMGTGGIDQLVTERYATTAFEPHVAALVGRLERKCDVMIAAIAEHFGSMVEVKRPAGGIFLWLKFPDGVDTRALVAPAAAAGIVFNAGAEWASTPGEGLNAIRLCFGLPDEATIAAGIAALAAVSFDVFGAPAHSGNVARAVGGA